MNLPPNYTKLSVCSTCEFSNKTFYSHGISLRCNMYDVIVNDLGTCDNYMEEK